MRMKRFLAVLLAMVLTISSASVPAAASRLKDQEHDNIDFLSLKYEHYDTTELEKVLDELEVLCKDSANLSIVEEKMDWIDEQFIVMADQHAIAAFHYEADPSDTYWAEENTYSQSIVQTFYALYLEKMKIICESPCKSVFTDEDIEILLEKKIPTPEELAMEEKHDQLVTEYYNYVPTCYYDGKEYNTATLEEDIENGTLSYLTALNIYYNILDAYRQGFGEIYLNIINNGNALAKLKGYDNYLDYVYKEQYKRSYTPSEIMKVCNIIGKDYKILDGNKYQSLWIIEETDKIINGNYLGLFGKIVEQMAPEFKESFDYMLATNSCVINPNGGVTNSYTYMVPGHGMPYILMEEEPEQFFTMRTISHEFGHYNADYWTDLKKEAVSVETHEVFSHGMELLATHYYDGIYGDVSSAAEKWELGIIIDMVYYSAFVSELEYTAFTGNFETVDDLVAALTKVEEKYYNNGNLYWPVISHIFSTPGYFISYMMTSLSALELYTKSKDNYDEAIDLYIKLLENRNEEPEEALKLTGLTYKWNEKTIKALLEKLLPYYVDNTAPVIIGAEDGKTYTGAVSIDVKDESGLLLTLKAEGETINPETRKFDIGGCNGEITLEVVDSFNNSTEIKFTVEPAPFTVTADIDTAGKQSLSWNREANATGYKVYGAPLGEKYKKLATLDKETTVFTNKKADDRVWKYYVVAVGTDEDGKKITLNKSYKSIISGIGNEKYTNVKLVEIYGSAKVNLKTGKNKTLSVSQTKTDEDKKLVNTKKIKTLRYYSSDENVAKVNSKGKITAVSKGSCYIYVISANGMTDKIKVNVG